MAILDHWLPIASVLEQSLITTMRRLVVDDLGVLPTAAGAEAVAGFGEEGSARDLPLAIVTPMNRGWACCVENSVEE
jgi:hypothetical protein